MTIRCPACTLLLAALAVATIMPVRATERPNVIGIAEIDVADREAAVTQKARALLVELVAAEAFARLPLRERLTKLDDMLARMRALSPELTGTRAAAVFERTLKDVEGERASVAVQLGRAPAAAPGAAEGPHPDFEWMGQQALSAMTNPLQREEFRASLARGIDFNVGVSSIEPAPASWLVQMSGRLGSSGTPGQGFFCRVAASDTTSLAVLRGITPPYGIVHMSAPGIDEFVMQNRLLRIRIVFEGCRITPPTGGASGRPSVGLGEPNRPASAGPPTAAPVAPSPAGLRCDTRLLRRDEERAMARRLRHAWAIPEPLRGDGSLVLTFAVTLNFDAELQAPPRLLRSQSGRATPDQLQAAADAADRAIRAAAPFPELGQFAGGTMQIDMTPCD